MQRTTTPSVKGLGAFLVASLLVASAGAVAARAEPFPKPPALVPRVEFWTRVYSEVDTKGGLIHDTRDLGVVYEVVRFPAGLSQRNRSRKVRERKDHYKKLLRTLASGKRSGLSEDQRRVLGLFPKGVSNSTLKRASGNVRFQLGQADKFRDGIVRSGRWEDYIQRVFAERGLPTDLGLLPHVESSFNPAAHSHAGASGIWQFTRSTGRMFMQVDHVVDERRDPFLASVAAARLLRSNYEKTGNWPLALTAYNHGAGGMIRAVRKLGTRDIGTIVERYKSRTFGFASQNFYTEFLAAREVANHSDRYFGPIRKDQPDDPEIVVLDHYYKGGVLADAFGVASSELRRANPALLQPIWSGQKYVPRAYGLRLPRQPGRASPKVVLASVPSGQRFAKQVPDRSYRVKRGDSLSKIARRFGVRESELVALNGLRSRHRIRVGQTLKLPVDHAAVASSSSPSSAPEPIPADGLYRVRRGDNIDLIARRFGVSAGDLVAVNGIRNKNRIQVGQVLQIPGGAVTARAPSSGASSGGVYVVRKGDTLHGIARRFGTSESALAERNGLRSRHRIQVGQRLYIPGAPAAVNSAPVERASAPPVTTAPPPQTAVGSAASAEPNLPLSPQRYRVNPDGSIRVQPDETLGHIAEWLELAPSSLRQANGLVRGQPIALGGRLRLDYTRVPRAIFEKRRLAHHRQVQEAFYGTYSVAGTQDVVLKRGDTLWKIAEGNGPVPVWLLLEYNPGVETATLRAGQRVRVPRLKRRG